MDSSSATSDPTQSTQNRITVRVTFLSNHTTHVEIRDGKRIFGEKADKKQKSDVVVNFVELSNDGLRIDLPPRTCSIGHKLEFELEVSSGSQLIRFRAQGTVAQADVFPHQHDSVAIKLSQYDRTIWAVILSLFQSQQTVVAELFTRLKGTVPA